MIEKILFYHPLLTLPAAVFSALQLTALALVLSKHKKAGLLLSASSLASTILLSLPITSTALLDSLQERHQRFKPSKNHEPANAVIALGGGVRPLSDSELNRELGEAGDRLAIAISLVKSGYAQKLVISGGLPSFQTSKTTPPHETLLGKTIAIRSGLKEEQIITNRAGHNTEAEASFIGTLSTKNNWRRMIISTSAYHMPRSLKKISSLSDSSLIAAPSDFRKVRTATLFKDNRLNAFVPTLSALNESTRSIKEYLGLFRASLKK